MFRTRPRGYLRAAALLVAGAAPLLSGAASATAAPSLDGLNGNVSGAPELKTDVADESGTYAGGKAVKLPVPTALPQTPQVLQAVDPAHALPASKPTAAVDGERTLVGPPNVSTSNQLPVNVLPVNRLPVDQLPSLPVVGPLPSTGLPILN
ncbi:hypothetical protein [Umezawaea sp. Da 62-37]|uniref:hypothetical protein n=1 Tax=Umezawaea sp. Da 62-37 TaxID=3075927 RepID=UPI0028F7106A|nr:hypothetical protein [Umezawaea sp. Da 62-37]WNV88805.1 hypothetical protein RM788_11045 [Umezawaea sp. Da 62-37]